MNAPHASVQCGTSINMILRSNTYQYIRKYKYLLYLIICNILFFIFADRMIRVSNMKILEVLVQKNGNGK